jgi:hypothetical protein
MPRPKSKLSRLRKFQPIIKKSKLGPKMNRKYCSCLQKVRTYQYKKNPRMYRKTKKLIRKKQYIYEPGTFYSEYAICNKTIYSNKNRKRPRNVNCSQNYNFDAMPLYALQAYAIDKHIPTTKNRKRLTKPQLTNVLKTYIKDKYP